MNRWISVFLIMAMVLAVITGCNRAVEDVIEVGDVEKVYAGTYRNGMLLVPEKSSANGIALDTAFRLSFGEDFPLERELSPQSVTILPEMAVTIDEDGDDLLIQPMTDLKTNQVYQVSVHGTTWVFQTESEFGLIGTLPRHQATGVPVNSGIEMYFSHPGADVEKYFSIDPAVKGDFEAFGSAVVFVPKELEPVTVYTVTLKKGLGIRGSDSVLKEDVSFSFETDQDPSVPFEEPEGYFNYFKTLNDRPAGEAVALPLNFYTRDPQKSGLDIRTKVYAYSTSEDMMTALKEQLDVPAWRGYWMYESTLSETKGLRKVMDFKQTIEDPRAYETTIDLPSELPEGFYLVQSRWKDITFQTFLQVTDLSCFWFEDDDKDYYWLNDLDSKDAITGAWRKDNPQIKSDRNGFLEIPKEEEEEGYSLNLLTDGDNELVHYTYSNIYRPYWGIQEDNDYWRYLQTDRQLYQPEDTVEVFGFLQHRDEGFAPETVTISIGEQRWFYVDMWPGMDSSLPLVKTEVSLEGGFFEANLELPNLAQGGYQIQVISDEKILATQYIEVEKYVKPDYKISVEADRNAIFFDETVNYQVTTAFFEGTAVADLETYYDVYGVSDDRGNGRTDDNGEFTVAYTPGYRDGFQDQVYSGFHARAVMPESGELYGETSVRVFMNDIHVDVTASEEEGSGTIEAKVHTITLDRLNDGTAEDRNDFLDAPVKGKVLDAVIYRNEWVKREVGEYYDFINKVTRKRYDYDLEKTVFDKVMLETDAEGMASLTLALPEELNVHYTMVLKTKDGKDHVMRYERYFRDSSSYYYPDDERLALVLDKDSYSVGDIIEGTMTLGGEPAKGEGFMFVYGSRGLKDVDWSKEPVLKKTFAESFVPNVQITGVLFDGRYYRTAYGGNPRVTFEDYRINLILASDLEEYRPGDEATVSIQAFDDAGEAIQDVRVNLAIVDEALLALRDMEINTLEYLYQWVDDGVDGMRGSHDYEPGDQFFGIRVGDEMAKSDSAMVTMDMAAEATEAVTGQSLAGTGADFNIRTVFKDTALFLSTALDEQGMGEITFTLPDNVTSWRVMAAALSEDLNAGSEIANMNVSLPFFINTNVNRTYLAGDLPYVGAAGYGSKIDSDTTIRYTVTCKENDHMATAEGKAYEKVSMPLFELAEGVYHIEVVAETDNGLTDGYEEVIEVVRTYQEKRVADLYDASSGLTIRSSDFGMTSLTFSDRGKGMYVPELYRLAYGGGKRVDQLWLAGHAWQVLEEQFGHESTHETTEIGSYITPDGGIALLPYGDPDPETTAKLAAFITEGSYRERVKGYLYQQYYGGDLTSRSMMLYGLASMGESVLLEVNQWQDIENLTVEDRLWLAMAYDALGDTYMAGVIYEDHIKGDMEVHDSLSRYVGISDEEGQYAMTSRLLPLLATVDMEVARTALDYVRSRYSEVYLPNSDILGYVTKMLAQSTDEAPYLTYSYDGETYDVDFNGWYGKTITLPSMKMDDFKVVDSSEDMVVVANYNALGGMAGDLDNQVSITRKYLDYETGEEKGRFSQGDIVKVVIDWNIDSNAIDHGYAVTDYVPSGLVPIKNQWQLGIREGGYWYRDIDGQKVTFGVYRDPSRYEPCVYYARVVSPGTFKADQAMIQGHQVLDSYNLSDQDSIIIEP